MLHLLTAEHTARMLDLSPDELAALTALKPSPLSVIWFTPAQPYLRADEVARLREAITR